MFRKLKSREVAQLERNTGEALAPGLYGCWNFRARKGERVVSRRDSSADNSWPSALTGYIGEEIVTNQRTLRIVYHYHEGHIDISEMKGSS